MTDRDATAEFAEFIAEVAAKARASERHRIRQGALDKFGSNPLPLWFADLLDGDDDA